jgi:hypothetical protein
MIQPNTNRKAQYGVLLVALAATFLPVVFIESGVLNYTHGVFIYPLDDVFIHMELARNLAIDATWGINKNEFGSASSSPLYTLLLSLLFRMFSANTAIPFAVNCIAAFLLLYALQKWLQKQQVNSGAQVVILLLAIFLAPLPVLIISGMEHTLQCLFSFLFLVHFSNWMALPNHSDKAGISKTAPIIIYGALVVAIRYEGLFLIAIACLILLWYKRWRLFFQLGLLSVLPVVIFGIVSVSNGSYFLPNSVLVKSDSIVFTIKGLMHFAGNVLIDKLTIARAGITLLATQRLLLILPIVLVIYLKIVRQKTVYRFMLASLFLCTLLHLAFATTGWFYRYEAYLVLSSVLVVSVVVYQHGRALVQQSTKFMQLLALCVALFLLFPFALRSAAAFSKAGQACINIFDQQYQMGQFLKRHYNSETFAANDIGAVGFYTQGQVLDLWGLGNIEVARSRKGGYWTPPFLDSIARKKKVQLAVVYDSWFDSSLLKKWNKVATWQIQNNVICGDDLVSFYAVERSAVPLLKLSLQAYQPSLPKSVAVRYY